MEWKDEFENIGWLSGIALQKDKRSSSISSSSPSPSTTSAKRAKYQENHIFGEQMVKLITKIENILPQAPNVTIEKYEAEKIKLEANTALLNNIKTIQDMIASTNDPVLLEKLRAHYMEQINKL